MQAKHLSWNYAAQFLPPDAPTSTSYSIPAWSTVPGAAPAAAAASAPHPAPDRSQVAALHESLIPNWTSTGFVKFVDACRAIVDELANTQTSGSGINELNNCEVVFKQVLWLWQQVWPDVTGMGEADDAAAVLDADLVAAASAAGSAPANGHAADEPVEPVDVPDDQHPGGNDAAAADSPYGGLGAVAAANRAA